MPKVVIEIEDQPNGSVRCTCTPNFEHMMKKAVAKDVTAAEAYAMFALTKIREKSKENGRNSLIELPSPGRIQ